jgi:hypothetical protein
MIIELKTKVPVMVDLKTTTMDIMYVTLDKIEFDGEKFSAHLTYETRVDLNPIPSTGATYDSFTLAKIVEDFSINEANTNESNLTINGTTVSTRLPELIKKSLIERINTNQLFGLDATDFEVI